MSHVPSPEADSVALLTVDQFWNERWFGPTTFAVRDHFFLMLDPSQEIVEPGRHVHAPGTVFAGFTDHHVHLGLVDPAQLPPGGITDVDDLGWTPEVARIWTSHHRDENWPHITTCGGFITAVDGYPSHSGWAPRAASVEVSTPEGARQAVADQRSHGATRIKVTLNSEAGPMLDDELLAVAVETAHELDLPVIAHVEGAGQAERAWSAGIDFFAHTPFSERLDDDLVRAMATHMTWISTFDIHGWGAPTPRYHVAIDNARRFVAAGGRMLYGTDLGNGPLPVGVNRRELQALGSIGLGRDALIAAIGTVDEAVGLVGSELEEGEFLDVIGPRFVYVPGTPPRAEAKTADWLATGRTVHVQFMTERSFA